MRTSYRSMFLSLAASVVAISLATAAPFDPVFRIMDVLGDVSVMLPGSDSYTAAESGKAYPYGTQIRTKSGASARVVYSEGNSGMVGPQAQLTVESTSIFLNAGKVEVTLQAENTLTVATPCSSGESMGGSFGVDVKPQSELMISVYTCKSGALSIQSEMFGCPELGPDDFLSVSCATDQSFVRLKNVKGEYDVSFTDDDGTPRVVALEKDGVVKIWRRKDKLSDAEAITILLVAPDGSLTEAINYTKRPAPQPQPDMVGDDDDDDDDGMAGDDDDDVVLPPDDQLPPDSGGDDDDDDDDDGTFPIPDDVTPKGLR